MKSHQRGETRKNNDIIRFFEDTNFNLGIIPDNEEEKQIVSDMKTGPVYHKSKRISTFQIRFDKLLKDKNVNKSLLGRELAKMTGREKPIARQTLDAYASGKSNPPLDIVIAICEYFGVSCDYLVGFEGNVTKEDKYISAKLGLSQDSINYLKNRKIATSNKGKDDKVLFVLNLLIKDMEISQQELRNKSNKSPTKHGHNILYYLSKYLDVDEVETMIAFNYESWIRIKESILSAVKELDLYKEDQRIEYYREKVEKLKETYNEATNNLNMSSFTRELKFTAYMANIENSLRKFRRQLEKEKGI